MKIKDRNAHTPITGTITREAGEDKGEGREGIKLSKR